MAFSKMFVMEFEGCGGGQVFQPWRSLLSHSASARTLPSSPSFMLFCCVRFHIQMKSESCELMKPRAAVAWESRRQIFSIFNNRITRLKVSPDTPEAALFLLAGLNHYAF